MVAGPAYPSLTRASWLDGLRAVAALMIFVLHAAPNTPVGGLDAGVLIFFTLSGYLLYRPFLERHVNVRTYAIRRLLRIYPAYLVAAVGIGWMLQVPLDPVGVLTMSATPVIVAWTLAIEVVFYAALPVIAFVAHGRRDVLLAMAVGSLAIAAVWMLASRTVPLGFVAWAWAFVPGMVVAQLAVQRPAVLARAASPAIPIAGLVLVAISVVPDIVFPDIPTVLGSALILAWLLTLREPPRRIAACLAAAGALSYSFYLWHEAILPTVAEPRNPGNAAFAFMLTVAVSALVYVLVERPAIVLGRRLSRASSAAAPGSAPLMASATSQSRTRG